MGKHVVITGALGNLGQKLIRHLLPHPDIDRITGVDARAASGDPIRHLMDGMQAECNPAALDFQVGDLRQWHDAGWRGPVAACDAVIHLAAQVPEPRATWDDAACSLDLNLHVGLAAVESKRCARLVFATTNHVMGRYKDEPLATATDAGALRPESPYGVGTVVAVGPDSSNSTAYATAKFAGERCYQALARADAGKGNTEFVNVRIGWCNAGDNHPSSLTATGAPDLQPETVAAEFREALARADRWFKEMWLSNRDFVHLFERALLADSRHWPSSCICVNGMSRNTGMKWSLESTRQWLGYVPRDDVYEHIAHPGTS